MTFNSTVKLTCKPGFRFDHGNRNQLVRCSENKKWTGLQNGKPLKNLRCKPIKCEYPGDTQYGMVEFSGLRVGSMARLDNYKK